MHVIRPITINDAKLTSSNVPEPESGFPSFNAGSTYALADKATYVATDIHWLIESLQAGNTGHTPTGLDTDTWWLKLGATNRWKMFDGFVNTQTQKADSIAVSFTLAEFIDSVTVIEAECATMQITMTDAVEGLVYDETLQMISDSGIDDYWEYFFEPVEYIRHKVIKDLPMYKNTTVTVTLNNPGGVAKCGMCILGQSRKIGDTQWDFGLSRTDYSTIKTAVDGTQTIVKRNNSRNISLVTIIPNTALASLDRLLGEYLSTPAVWEGTDVFGEATTVYGIYQRYNILAPRLNESVLSIEILGMI